MKTYARRLCIVGPAFCMAVGLAAMAPLGCGSTTSCLEPPCETGGAAGTAGTAGSTGTAGAAGNAGTGGNAGSGGGGGGTAGSGGNGTDSGWLCGGIANLKCPETMYCEYRGNACGGGEQNPGVCMLRPDLCSRDCPGACGCDGKFYCNVCEAQRAGFDGTEGACSDAASLRARR